MIFEYTDDQLNAFNLEKGVYSVNEELAKKTRNPRITDKNDDELEVNEINTIEVSDGNHFKVVATLDDPATGFQGMAVAPIVNGQVDTNSVAVVAAGTTPTDVNDLIFILRKK